MSKLLSLLGVSSVLPNLKGARMSAVAWLLAMGFSVLQMPAAQAITNGEPDSGDPTIFPYVGGGVDPDPFNPQFCSGVAISPTLVLTSGHCFAVPGQWVWVSFAFDVSPATFPNGWQSGSWFPHPDFCFACSPKATDIDTHDVGVVILDEPVALGSYALLPPAGFVKPSQKARALHWWAMAFSGTRQPGTSCGRRVSLPGIIRRQRSYQAGT